MSKEKPKKDEDLEAQGVALPIEWYTPESIASRYATNIVVQHTGHEFIISFFEARPPLVIGQPEVVREALEQIHSVRAECVARIIVSKDRMPGFVRALRENLDRFQPSSAEKMEQA